jgi:PAS domain S-box-containing protein
MNKQLLLNRLKPNNPWHYIWIAILASEFFTFILNSLQSYLRWGYISGSLIEIGVIDAFVSSAIIAPIVIYFLKSANDRLILEIKERKLAEDALNESRDQFKKAVDKSPRPMALVSSDGIIEYINQKAVEVFGYLPEDIPDMDHWWVRAYPDEKYRDEVIAQWMRLVGEARLNNREIERKEYHVTCKDGRVLVTSIYGIWVVDKVLAMFDDITDRKKLEERLKEDRDRLEEIVAKRTEEISNLHRQLLQSQKLEAVGILAGGIAHEFSNILTTMKGSAYLIQKKLSDDSTVNKYAEQIVSSIAKASNLSQGLLSFSRKQTMSLRPVLINNTVGRIFKILRQFIGEHIELSLLLAEEEATVVADAHQIEQVLVNLAINARDAMPKGGTLTIKTDLFQMDDEFIKKRGYGIRGSYVVLTVSDTGMGMKEDVLSKIFEPFFTTKPVGKGSGLGLAITYGIIKQHNGFIDVASLPGHGTTFEIYIPKVHTKVTPEQATEAQPVRHGYETILLAEDDSDALAVMRDLLEMSGYAVFIAGDGEEAVKVFEANKDKIQLVITDVRMPKKNGRVVYDEIIKIAPTTKILFTSGYTADVLDSHGIVEDGLEFMSKTASPSEFLAKVREILDCKA